MRHVPVRSLLTLLAGAMLLAGCAGQRLASLPAPRAGVVPPRPVEPAGLPMAAQVPIKAADGRYVTPAYGATEAEAAWDVRAALNVAALGCRGADEAVVIAGYNAVLARQKVPLAAAYKAVQAQDRARLGAQWQDAHDRQMTRLYNFFAQPFAKQDFCIAAKAVLARAQAVEPAGFTAFAAAALPELEAPFVAAYQRYAAYRQELADWDATYGGTGVATGAGTPRLAYAPMETIIAWVPPGGSQRIALKR